MKLIDLFKTIKFSKLTNIISIHVEQMSDVYLDIVSFVSSPNILSIKKEKKKRIKANNQ